MDRTNVFRNFTKECANTIVEELKTPQNQDMLKSQVVDPMLSHIMQTILPYIAVFTSLLAILLIMLGVLVFLMYRDKIAE